LDGSFAFQDYAIAKWFYHVNAWVGSGAKFLDEGKDLPEQLQNIFRAMDDFMARYSEVDWSSGLVDDCKTKCSVFAHLDLHDHVVALTSHIYTFQQRGFKAQHKISIDDLSKALDRNRKILEVFPKTKPGPTADEKTVYARFYDEERRFKCTRITCRYFSEGFKDEKARKRHVNIHDRPFQCEIPDCLGAEGFANSKDLEKHTRAFHPEISDLAEKFISDTVKREKTNHVCSLCGKTFSRNFHRKNHELSHRGERPHECAECGKAFTRLNDLKRHQKIHDRK
jgi:DNA-directed RNA polymerase subunit RPC12/RpoP